MTTPLPKPIARPEASITFTRAMLGDSSAKRSSADRGAAGGIGGGAARGIGDGGAGATPAAGSVWFRTDAPSFWTAGNGDDGATSAVVNCETTTGGTVRCGCEGI